MYNSIWWVLPVEKVSGMLVLWLMEFQADPSNSHSGMVDESLVSTSLFLFFAKTSSTKQWEEPESNKAMNGQACSDMEVDVRERRKEFGEREVEFSHITGAVLSLFGQLLNSAMLKKSPLSFPISQIQSPALEHSPILPQPEALWHVLALQQGICLPSGYQNHRLDITCSCADIQAPLV